MGVQSTDFEVEVICQEEVPCRSIMSHNVLYLPLNRRCQVALVADGRRYRESAHCINEDPLPSVELTAQEMPIFTMHWRLSMGFLHVCRSAEG